MDFKELKSQIDILMTPALVAILMQDLGYSDAHETRNFKMRDERNASASISKKSKISDFGDDFVGKSIYDLIMRDRGVEFIEALKWVAVQLNFDIENEYTKRELPARIYEASQKKTPIDDDAKKRERHRWTQQKNFDNKARYRDEMVAGLVELFPNITPEELESVDHLVAFGVYQKNENNTSWRALTVELDEASAVRRGVFFGEEAKWITHGSKRYIYQKYSKNDEYIYFASGMAEVLAMEAMGLPCIVIQADGIRFEESIEDVGQTIVVLEENDDSSRDLTTRVKKHFQRVKVVDLATTFYNGHAPRGWDFRDFINYARGFETAKMMLEPFVRFIPIEEREVVDEIIIPFGTPYIPKINIDKGVVVAPTSRGKTYQFEGVSGVLILVPRVMQSSVYVGEDSNFLINKIFDSGAIITFDKFYGHFRNNDEFRKMIDTKKIKLIVDEAHILTQNVSRKNKMIYELDAIFLSATISKSFRSDLQRYKYKPPHPTTINYTDGVIPKILRSIVFVDNAKGLMQNYPNNCIVSNSHEFKSVDPHTTKEPIVFTTSALREGISIHNPNFDTTIVVAQKCNLWSNKDWIQAVHRVRGEKTLKIVTSPPKKECDTWLGVDFWEKIIKQQTSTRVVNAIIGEYYSDMIKITHKTSSYISTSEYGIACFLAKMSANNYDKDFYRFEPLEGDYEAMELELDIEDDGVEDGIFYYTFENGEQWACDEDDREAFLKWAMQYESGIVQKMFKFEGIHRFKEIYTKSNMARNVKKAYNAINKKAKKKYSISLFYTLMTSLVKIELYNEDKKPIKRLRKLSDLDSVFFRVVDICPIESANQVSNLS